MLQSNSGFCYVHYAATSLSSDYPSVLKPAFSGWLQPENIITDAVQHQCLTVSVKTSLLPRHSERKKCCCARNTQGSGSKRWKTSWAHLNQHYLLLLPPPPELHHSGGAAQGAAARAGRVLHQPHDQVLRLWRSRRRPGLHLLLQRSVRRERLVINCSASPLHLLSSLLPSFSPISPVMERAMLNPSTVLIYALFSSSPLPFLSFIRPFPPSLSL